MGAKKEKTTILSFSDFFIFELFANYRFKKKVKKNFL